MKDLLKSYYRPEKLLTTNNAKTVKGEKLGYTTYILYLAPHRQNSQGKNICPMASAGCIAACLYSSGHGSMSGVQKGRMNKTEFFLSDREDFLKALYIEIAQIELKHKLEETKFAIRLNGTSDLSWETFHVKDNKNIFDLFPTVQFYDYTKNHNRFKKALPANYSLLFSRSETNEKTALELLSKGINVAIVFDTPPSEYKGYRVINGDETDLRFKDEKGVIIGLKYKRLTSKGVDNQKVFETGFGVRVAA